MPVGPRACPKCWDPESKEDCECGDILPCPDGFEEVEGGAWCEPVFDECGDMEVPVLGGGCMPVGNRACPKCWDPEWEPGSGPDCECGDKLPCPEGFAEVEDGAWCEPHFDECGESEVAVLGGGCLPVGPRACPKCWDPEAGDDCECGEALPCPDGFAEAGDGGWCEPIFDECGQSEVPVLGGGCEPAGAALPCPQGVWPEPPESATSLVYVDGDSPCTDGCGAKENPYASLAQAVAGAPEGAAVLVAEGTYDEGIELLQNVSVVGMCAAKTRLAGHIETPEETPAGFDLKATVYAPGTKATLAGLAIENGGDAVGILATGGASVVLNGGEIAHAGRHAVYATAATVEFEASVVRDTLPDQDGQFGRGIQAMDASSVLVLGSVIAGNQNAGIIVWDSALTVEDSAVRDNKPDPTAQVGRGIEASDGAQVTVVRSLLKGNAGAGIAVFDSSLKMSKSLVLDTQPEGTGLLGRGVDAYGSSDVVLERSVVAASHDTGVRSLGSKLSILGCVVRDTAPDVNGGFGRGVDVEGKGEAAVRLGVVSGSSDSGVTALSSTMAIDRSLLAQNARDGVRAADASVVELDGVRVQDTTPDVHGELGRGLEAYGGSELSLVRSIVARNTGIGAYSSESTVSMADCLVADTLPDLQDFGPGIIAEYSSTVTMRRSLVRGNAVAGLYILGSSLEVEGRSIREPRPGCGWRP
jgi:hypothetical protein